MDIKDQSAIDALPIGPESRHDPRLAYPGISKEGAYRGWPCGECGIRRDEHADQLEGKFPELDITDHEFVEPSED